MFLASVICILSVAAVKLALWLFTLPAGPTLVAAMTLIPALAPLHYCYEEGRPFLAFVRAQRAPFPPERFYWSTMRGRLLAVLRLTALTAPVWWILALKMPASLDMEAASLTGWFASALAITTTSIALSTAWLYTVASQKVDTDLPWFIGSARRVMYQLSHNPDFL